MNRVEMVVPVEAPLETVWEVLTTPSNIPALYPDAISIQSDPPGRSVAGQRYTIVGKVGRRKIVVLAQLAELVPMKRIVTRNTPGGLFRAFEQTILLEPRKSGVDVNLVYEYEVSAGYVGKVLNDILVERLVKDNLKRYGRNLKEFAELVPMTSG